MNSKELREKFIKFYESKNHSILPSSSLVPKEDPTVLFTTAGMQPLIPYLLGQTHPAGNRLANLQKCIRTGDIEEVGDNRHLTFFEMMGVWSLGDYFKEDSIKYTYEFLTSPDYLGLDPRRLFVTVYRGCGDVKADHEAIKVWQDLFDKSGVEPTTGVEYDFKNPENNKPDQKYIYRITQKSGNDNWWGLPYKGPCGPCSEVYYLMDENPLDFEQSVLGNLSGEQIEDFLENQIVEIWNNVFMQYEGEKDENSEPKNLSDLSVRNIDTGAGYERLLTVLNQKETLYQTDLFTPIIEVIEKHKAQS